MRGTRADANMEPLLPPSTERTRNDGNLQINVRAAIFTPSSGNTRWSFFVFSKIQSYIDEVLVDPGQFSFDNMATFGGQPSRSCFLGFSELIRGSSAYSHAALSLFQDRFCDTWPDQKSWNGWRHCWQIYRIASQSKRCVLGEGSWSRRHIDYTGRTFKPVCLNPFHLSSDFVFSGISDLPSLTFLRT